MCIMLIITSVYLYCAFIIASCDDQLLSRHKRLAYIDGSAMGLFLALAVPIDIPRKNVFVAYNFEANYLLPNNDTAIEHLIHPVVTTARKGSLFNRTLAYKVLESKMETHGYAGRACLLRTICEASASAMEHNGLLGELLHVVLTPSSSEDEGLPNTFSSAEVQGRTTGTCDVYHTNCTTSFMDIISWIGL